MCLFLGVAKAECSSEDLCSFSHKSISDDGVRSLFLFITKTLSKGFIFVIKMNNGKRKTKSMK